MYKKKLWEKEPYSVPECEKLITHLNLGLCQSGGGSGGDFNDNPDDVPFFPDDDLLLPDIEIL